MRGGEWTAVFDVEEDERGAGDVPDAPRVEADQLQSGKGFLQQGVGAFADAVDPADDLVVGALICSELTTGGFFDRVEDRWGHIDVAQVSQRRHAVVGGDLKAWQQAVGGAGAGGVVLASRAHVGGPDQEAGRVGEDLDVVAVVLALARPPQVGPVRAGSRDPVGVDERAVQVDVGVACDFRRGQCRVQVRGERGEHVDALVQVVVGGALGDPVVGGELADTGVVREPAQHKHRLRERAQCPGVAPGADLGAMLLQQPGQEPHGLPPDGQGGGEHDGIVCKTGHGKASGTRQVSVSVLIPATSPSCFTRDQGTDRTRPKVRTA
ncbi:hypothetical protein GCM10023322_07970 [Rugosimonospora acidiphila]|uniref:Uncharacterized protein n=1 Tax=Rugosimonospora acidiphila TaxID=556531 RepID=A0ABP9RL54_9ACTN